MEYLRKYIQTESLKQQNQDFKKIYIYQKKGSNSQMRVNF